MIVQTYVLWTDQDTLEKYSSEPLADWEHDLLGHVKIDGNWYEMKEVRV